jgi:hypothetical protein
MRQDVPAQFAARDRAERERVVEALARWPRLSGLLRYMGDAPDGGVGRRVCSRPGVIELWVEGEPGKGSTFYFTAAFPLVAASSAAQMPSQAEPTRPERDGTEIVLASASLEDENSIEQPRKVAAVTQIGSGLSANFTRTFAHRSLTVLCLKTPKAAAAVHPLAGR